MTPGGASAGPHRGPEELGDFPTANRRILTLSVWAAGIGVLGALIAAALFDLIGFFTNLFYFGRLSIAPVTDADTWGILSIGVPVVGGLIVGLMARFGSERIRGHGIPEALESILIDRSRVSPALAALKPVSSAVAIGTGGPFGAEGPIIMTGGALGSVVGQFLKITAVERKTLLVAGAAAGMAAFFNTPVAAVLLAVELLLFEWKPRSLIPVGVASITATFLGWYLVPAHGFGPLFPMVLTGTVSGATLLGAAAVGLIAGVLATVLTVSVYRCEDAFRKLPVHWMWWPAIGGVVVGIGGLISVESLGTGYGTICLLLGCTNSQLTTLGPVVEVTLIFVATLLVVKAIIWVVALASGTSGGILAPLLIIGGALGVIEAHFLPFGTAPFWALVSMSATLGGAMRAPLTGVVFAVELTHDVNALLPLLIAGLLADGFMVLALKRSILTEKIARRGVHVASESSVDPLERIPVRSVMHGSLWPVSADQTVGSVLRRTRHSEITGDGLLLLNENGAAEGFAFRRDLERYLALGGDPDAPVRSQAVPGPNATYPDEPVRLAADRMAQCDRRAIPVVDPGDPTHLLGFCTRDALFDARVRWNALERDRERLISLSPADALRRWKNRRGTRELKGTKDR